MVLHEDMNTGEERQVRYALSGNGFVACLTLLLLSVLSTSITMAQEPPILSDTTAMDTSSVIPDDFNGYSVHTIKGIQYERNFVEEKLRRREQKITVFGYYRLFGYGRNMTEAYPNLSPYERAYSIGDGYREPMLSLSVVGRPNGKSSFGTELFIFTPYTGLGPEENVISTNLGINFYGNFRTQHGNFGVRAGGIHWYNLSPFTIGVYQILDRFSIFDRTPWEGVNNTLKYDSYYATGVTSPGDLRWNNQAFQGLIVNGAKLPGEIAFDMFWGKTQPNGGLIGAPGATQTSIPNTLEAGNVPDYLGFNGLTRVLPSVIMGGKVGRAFGKKENLLAYNLMHSETALDSINTDLKRLYQVHTLSLDLKLAKIRVTGELGAGKYESPTYTEKWGEALMLRFYIPEAYTYLPLDVQVYQISKNFFNQNGEIFTNSNPDIINDVGLIPGAIGAGGQIALVNQLVHNRRGININTGIEAGPAKVNIGWGLAQEMDATSTVLTYVHRINGLALSRIYNPFPENPTGPVIFGPYGRQISFFRGVSEVVQTTDIDAGTALTNTRKYFNAVDIQAKLKSSLFDKDLFFFYLGSFGSAKSAVAPLPTMNEDSYLFVQYHEFDVYFEILPNFILTGYLGLENARGGTFTDWDAETQLPRDQHGRGIGVGFDWTIAENCGLYFRHRWMTFEDRSFALNTYKGREITLELKTFF